VDVAGIEPASSCLQTKQGKILTGCLVSLTRKISDISALLDVPKLSRTDLSKEPDDAAMLADFLVFIRLLLADKMRSH
jgi:hypothetical protein